MNNLNDLINLAKADGGKFFILDEQGNASLVIMPVEEYQKLLIGKLQKQMLDVEKINKEILNAQLTEDITPVVSDIAISNKQVEKGPTVISHPPDLTRFDGHPITRPGAVDLREEVIDPSFDFEGPKLDLDDI